MHIAIHCGGMAVNGDTIPAGNSLGGSESACFYMARELARRGHDVIVFTNSRDEGRFDGVLYNNLGTVSKAYPLGDTWHLTMQAPYDVVIVQRNPYGFLQRYNSKVNIWWLHDLALHRSAGLIQQHLVNIDRIFTVSEFHRAQVSDVWGIDREHIYATHNGVDYDAYNDLALDAQREPRSLVFASRPERGLAELVGSGGIMERLPDCRLYVCGYDITTDRMRDYYRYLWDKCDALGNVTNMGALGKGALARLLANKMLCVYPTTFEDTSNMLLLEANAAGTPFIGCRTAALPETGRGAGVELIPLKSGRVDQKAFVKSIKSCLKNRKWSRLHRAALAKRQTWTDAAAAWEDMFVSLMREKSSNRVRLYKHLEHTSDICALLHHAGHTRQTEWAEPTPGPVDVIEDVLPDFRANYGFLLNGDYKGHYERYYQYERDRGVTYGPEDLTGNPRFECICDLIQKHQPKTVLDYGCAHGHYVMNLARRMPDVMITGIDLEPTNIETAVQWAFNESPLHIPEFRCGEHTDIPDGEQYDLIICAEVLEHVPDPAGIITTLMQHLAPGGTMLVSVPYGPWEAMGYEKHPGWRAHIHHFERTDLHDLFGAQDDYRLLSLPHRGGLGHFVCTFKPSGAPVGRIDYERKLCTQAPAETLSVCMIVKDGEHTLGKCLKKLAGIADEIIIGIDKTTTDRTLQVAVEFGAQCFSIDSPLEIGFDAARNLTLDRAAMDWILWIDDDESLEQAESLKKYLRPNCYNGYAVRQHHYATEPAGIIRTDLPVRLFRNHKQIRFWGMVHEHPSAGSGMNDGVGKVMLLPEPAIMHTGYPTEAIRRKRFERNLPLMRRDREVYTERRLGLFFWVRDLCHLIRYTIETGGDRRTPEILAYASEIIDLFRTLAATGDVRLIKNALPYYSDAVRAIGGGVDFTISLGAVHQLQGGKPAPRTLAGCFACNQDIEDLTQLLLADTINIYQEQYY